MALPRTGRTPVSWLKYQRGLEQQFTAHNLTSDSDIDPSGYNFRKVYFQRLGNSMECWQLPCLSGNPSVDVGQPFHQLINAKSVIIRVIVT